jgi:hypothetical protein
MDSKSGSYKAVRGLVGAETTRSARLLRTANCIGRETAWEELPASNQYYDSVLEGIDLTKSAVSCSP